MIQIESQGMQIIANSTESKRKIYDVWKNTILPSKIQDGALLDQVLGMIPDEWYGDGRFSFHHFTTNFPEHSNRLICEDPRLHGRHIPEEQVMSMLRNNNQILINEMEQVIVVPTYMHDHKNIIENSMKKAYEKYFEMEELHHVELEMKKFLVCLRELQNVREKFIRVFEGYDPDTTGKIIEDLSNAIKKLRSFRLNLKKRLTPSRDLEDFKVM